MIGSVGITLEDALELQAPEVLAAYGAVLLVPGIVLLPVIGWLVRRSWPDQPRATAPCLGALDLFVLAALYLALQMVIGGVVLGPVAEPGEPVVVPVHTALWINASAMLGAAALALSRARRTVGGLASLGLRRGRNLLAARLGAGSWVLLVPMLWGLALVWPWIFESLGGDYAPQPWGEGIARVEGGAKRAEVVLFAALIIPVLEEVLFRGAMQPCLVRLFGPVGGIGTTAAVFAALHDVGAYLPVLSLAVLLGWLAWRTGRLAAPIAVHVIHNGVQTAILFAAP